MSFSWGVVTYWVHKRANTGENTQDSGIFASTFFRKHDVRILVAMPSVKVQVVCIRCIPEGKSVPFIENGNPPNFSREGRGTRS